MLCHRSDESVDQLNGYVLLKDDNAPYRQLSAAQGKVRAMQYSSQSGVTQLR